MCVSDSCSFDSILCLKFENNLCNLYMCIVDLEKFRKIFILNVMCVQSRNIK